MNKPNSAVASSEQVQSVLIPQHQTALLLPSAAVIEILGYRELKEPAYESRWVLGEFSWRHLKLPLVSMERLLGVERKTQRGRKRIIVVHVFSTDLKAPFVGIESTGMPRLIAVDENNLKISKGESWPNEWPITDVVDVLGSQALIPDLQRLGQLVADQKNRQ